MFDEFDRVCSVDGFAWDRERRLERTSALPPDSLQGYDSAGALRCLTWRITGPISADRAALNVLEFSTNVVLMRDRIALLDKLLDKRFLIWSLICHDIIPLIWSILIWISLRLFGINQQNVLLQNASTVSNCKLIQFGNWIFWISKSQFKAVRWAAGAQKWMCTEYRAYQLPIRHLVAFLARLAERLVSA